MTPAPAFGQHARNPPRLFEHQLHLDRQVIHRELLKFAADTKWKQMTPRDREHDARTKIEAKLLAREKAKNTTTARLEYPNKYDDEGEMQNYLDVLKAMGRDNGYGVGDGEDDPEPLPTSVKKEPNDDDESDDEQSEVSSDDEEANVEIGEDDADVEGGKNFGSCDCNVVSRGFVITSEEAEAGDFPMVKAEAKSALNGNVQGGGTEKELIRASIKRSWKWLGGKMLVWPPLDVFTG